MIRLTVLGIINEVERLLNVKVSSTLTERKLTQVLLRFLNETVDECADFGRWQELYDEVLVTASSSVSQYTVAVSGLVANIEEISFQGETQALIVKDRQDIRRLQRLASYGIPRQYAVIDVNVSGYPIFRPYPIPGSNQNNKTFRVHYYIKPPLYTTSDGSTTPVFPANVLIKGTYAKALLDENGGEPTNQYQVAYAEYTRMRKEALNRFTGDTGMDTHFRPGYAR